MKVDRFDFYLPENNIALHPASPRGAGRLLRIIPPDRLADYYVRDLPLLLQPGDALVFNDTKTIPARLEGRRYRRPADDRPRAGQKPNPAAGEMAIANIGVNLHQRIAGDKWRAFVKPARRLRLGEEIIFTPATSPLFEPVNGERRQEPLSASVQEKGEAGDMLLQFNKAGAELDAALMRFGTMPLPPYIVARRAVAPQDSQDYQTVYAREEGAVAAPTAGLHFTPALLADLAARGVEQYFITLHVGAGTFLPVKAADTKDHKMHAESGVITAETAAKLQKVKERGGKIIAVGTTALRLLESAATADGRLPAWSGATDIFITPGYQFRFVDRLMTNFHLPRSTLFMLVAAFSGLDLMKKAYAHAIEAGYRFYSYGDTSLLDLAKRA
ncbi:MAG: tRNA preQ1(34) S-adenosylmethionine ribosyltransferase-isomerase QueA [Candidatus Tokpelaia sp.]|uniref:tRNA preQ1(34) S-adenosylmethionine ribosyltransferase-isomerase QueA n=1 Tax=Candidatus Tokpelaia sp. TaxID=2233777 RepID=UPI001239CC88|nr:tRNA preQ1(34) S-adenosylmethionine ribosyltransferase-isomerase QueA [Candidatus Tokpelaia sp.]KAA6206671.1 MAG: tRNA preQ1(34) S-adenosylmethionine ribosyltransferase-isomerase QueA [Candidatus Tokpelaia sp.]KAA6206966.1 MAG: tRNA preQ1(34) S-adenosylmethionine ribosyltransferase-isomerase QueA [Candidatus Tokpelaia sp.]KAA6405553.1 tRNA preQ1(34) S-adenosylmethionine ribosyltransferase-isomerase QueA [Candidatus Tokpelaia sp.]